MKKLIENFIAFLRFIFKGKMPNKPVVNPEWDTKEAAASIRPEQTFVSDDKYKIGGLATLADGTTQVFAPTPSGSIIQVPLPLPDMARQIVLYMEQKGYFIDRNPNNGNIVYLSEMRDAFGVPKDGIDEWDDIRLILKFDGDIPYIDFFQSASTEPGSISRKSAAAKKLGGVATVVPGQYKAWKFGYHKHNHDHPALVQCANITIWRDRNENARFDNEMMFEGVYGINQHSTKPGFSGPRVGAWSAGCLVGKNFEQHLEFLDRLKQWDCYKANPNCVFYTTIIPGKALWKEESPLSV